MTEELTRRKREKPNWLEIEGKKSQTIQIPTSSGLISHSIPPKHLRSAPYGLPGPQFSPQKIPLLAQSKSLFAAKLSVFVLPPVKSRIHSPPILKFPAQFFFSFFPLSSFAGFEKNWGSGNFVKCKAVGVPRRGMGGPRAPRGQHRLRRRLQGVIWGLI